MNPLQSGVFPHTEFVLCRFVVGFIPTMLTFALFFNYLNVLLPISFYTPLHFFLFVGALYLFVCAIISVIVKMFNGG